VYNYKTKTNNTFVYSGDSGATCKTLTIPVGCYEIAQINTALELALIKNGFPADSNGKYSISISGDTKQWSHYKLILE
jgi:hypothetical protein